MDKNAIKKYAVWARRELIARVSQKALQYGISETDFGDAEADSINGVVLSAREKSQRSSLIAKIRKDGYQQAMEEAAYTWFNRFTALRYMEVNAYLPSHVRVFTNDRNEFKPQIIDEAINLEIDGLDLDKVYEYKDANKTEELYKYLLITQCNDLGKILPGMFKKISDYTELLFPDNLLREGSVIEQMITLIPEEDWNDQVQIIGWLYQYYNTEPKDKVFEGLKKNIKITKENIPAATQLFTPDWIVRYMVENSLGRLWTEGHGKPENAEWKYYLEEAEQEPEVQEKLAEIRKEYADMKPEDIKCIDPCMGSGHILVYMFDVLVQIYESYGYSAREAAGMILENNLYGLDIDDRAAQLAYFSVMMKARQYDRRIFTREINPHIHAIVESNDIDNFVADYFVNGDNKLKADFDTIVSEMHDAKEYGSLITVSDVDFEAMYRRIEEVKCESSLYQSGVENDIVPLIQVAEMLSNKYDICCTNPPYMALSGADSKLSDYAKKYFPDSKTDLFACFIERCGTYAKTNGLYSMITQHAFMFLSSYENLRGKLALKTTVNMAHLGARAFDEIGGEVVQTTSFVNFNSHIKDYVGTYSRLVDVNGEKEKEQLYLSKGKLHTAKQENFSKIPGSPVAYWVSDSLYNVYQNAVLLEKYVHGFQGMITGNNDYFLRLWQELDVNDIVFNCTSNEICKSSYKAWIPYKKGGGLCRWYGNSFYVLRWENEGKGLTRSRTENKRYYLEDGVTWSYLTSGVFSANYYPKGYLWDVHGSSIFDIHNSCLFYYLGILNSSVGNYILNVTNPTLSYQVENILSFPIIQTDDKKSINELVENNISISKIDWDSFEISWNFEKHPFINGEKTISESFDKWSLDCEERFNTLKSNEEELNRLFIDIYGLQNELVPEVEDKDVTFRKADLTRDIKNFISYAVGCMFGRYSLDVDGLAFAGGEWDNTKYKSFIPSEHNIIPISDDEYFKDDITERFISFVKTVYGEETLEENLQFIADALGGKGSPREIIRKYFINDFFADHCKIYQKRPIYWLFDSGKKNGFKALIYMHRYQPDTIARIRTDYVHEQQNRYRTAISDIEQRMSAASTSERVKLTKELRKLNEQADELLAYEEKIHHLADQMISIDLDDGVKNNYEIFKDVLAKIK